MVISAQMQNAVNEEYGQFMIDTPLMTARLTNGLWQGNDDIPQQGRWRAGPFPGRKGQHIRGVITMTKASIQAAHPVVAYDFEAEQRLAFTDGLEDTIGEAPERREAQRPPRKPHADHDRH
jgi:hypothetical protein